MKSDVHPVAAKSRHRFFLRRIDELMITMAQEASKLVDILQGDREEEPRL